MNIKCPEYFAIIRNNKFDISSIGLYEYISDSEMFDIIKNPDIEEPVKLLLDMANNAGGKDNITVVTVEG